MVGTLIGIKNIEFTDEKSGKTISGRRLYITYDDDSVTGTAADSKFFASDSKVQLPASLTIKGKYDFVYQSQGFSGKAVLVAVKPYTA